MGCVIGSVIHLRVPVNMCLHHGAILRGKYAQARLSTTVPQSHRRSAEPPPLSRATATPQSHRRSHLKLRS